MTKEHNEYAEAIKILESELEKNKRWGFTAGNQKLQSAIEQLQAKVIAEGIINYKGTELMGTIGKEFIDVVMKKNNGQYIKITTK